MNKGTSDCVVRRVLFLRAVRSADWSCFSCFWGGFPARMWLKKTRHGETHVEKFDGVLHRFFFFLDGPSRGCGFAARGVGRGFGLGFTPPSPSTAAGFQVSISLPGVSSPPTATRSLHAVPSSYHLMVFQNTWCPPAVAHRIGDHTRRRLTPGNRAMMVRLTWCDHEKTENRQGNSNVCFNTSKHKGCRTIVRRSAVLHRGSNHTRHC